MHPFQSFGASVSATVSRLTLIAALGATTLALASFPAEARTRHKRIAAAAAADLSLPQWTGKPAGPVIFVVSIADQRLTIYDNGVPVARTVVSTGVTGHLTPRGIFSIIQKDRYHKSNIYSDAPMPFMQRITWSGIAMHEGHVTGRPASHGCIRLPRAFAARLWPYTKMGMRVIVSNTDVTPEEFMHPKLFTALKPDVTTQAEPTVLTRYAQAENMSAHDAQTVEAASPANGAATLELPAIVPVPDAPAELVLDPKVTEPVNPSTATVEPVAPPVIQSTEAQTPEKASEPVVASPVPNPMPSEALPEIRKEASTPILIPPGTGHVSIFISKKEGKLFVRRNFVPIFETPVVIHDPARPLGSHLYTAMDVKDDGANVKWSVVDVQDTPPPVAPPRRRKGEAAPEPVVPPAPSSSAEALDRIVVPDDARVAIAGLMQPGLSLIVTDQGFGRETGKGTDFIVLTR